MRKNGIPQQMKIAASQNIKEREYWLNQLTGDLVKRFFPYDRQETTGHERHFDSVNFLFSGELFSNLIRVSSKSDKRLHMILAAGLAILLNKYTGDKDIIVGMPIYKQEIEGKFINTVLPLRIKPEPHMTFKQLILQVRQTISAACENQNYPMKILLYKLNFTSSDTTGISLFDAAILLENIQDKSYLEDIPYNMLFSLLRTGESMEGKLEYNASLYEKTTIRRIAGHYRQLFKKAFSNLDQPIADIDILQEEERNQILLDFNNTDAAYPGDKTIHELLEIQVKKTPGKIAVIYNGQHLTYRELNEKANQLARLLREKSIKPGSIVGILLEPCPELITGIAAVLKAGGAFLPIDHQYPENRILSILRDRGIPVLLTGKKILEHTFVTNKDQVLPGKARQDILFLDHITVQLAGYSKENLPNINQPGDLLYLISTSGSTGMPKSLMLEHRNMINLLYFDFFETGISFKRLPQFSSIGFDMSSHEIFAALLTGGELYLMDSDMKQDVIGLLAWMWKNQMNVVFWPPAFLKYVFSDPEHRARFPRSLEHIITSGEQLIITEPIRRYLKEHRVHLHNHYGPAETHVVTAITFEPSSHLAGIPPIGKPISNTRIYILDENKKVKPVGTIGELYISGANLGRGYLNNPELTAQKFQRGWHPRPGKNSRYYRPYTSYIIYKTGDLARWLPDGNIEFIGRTDFQVKIRGFRIELGEIETRLLEIDFIKEAVVLDLKDPKAEKFLCAYIVSEKEIEIPGLKKILSHHLPGYMIPAYFVRLERIPVTSNGKVDKKALPGPEFKAEVGYSAPRDGLEEKLAGIWSEVLGIEKGTIGIDANFFHLGGHSLKATILITRIHKEFHVKITLADMFKQPTIRGLSGYIKKTGPEIFKSIKPVEKKEYHPLSSAQKRVYILQQMEIENTGYNNPSVLVLEGKPGKEKLEKTLGKLIKRHESLRTSFEMIQEQPAQKVHEYHDMAFAIKYYQMSENEAVHMVQAFKRPFDLGQPPLLRVEIIKVEKKHILMFDMHHIITDGTSMQVFIKEFMALYAGKELPALRVQYKDFSKWQNKMFDSGEIKKQEEYWLTRLANGGEIPVLNLHTDYPRPEIQNFAGSAVNFLLESEQTGALKELAKSKMATMYMVLLSIYNVLLAKISGQQDIMVGTPIAGRRHADLHHIIGMFVNTLVMRNYPEGAKTFAEFLAEVKEKTLAAFENQDFPFEELVNQIDIRRDTGRNPLVDVVFTMQNMEVLPGSIPEANTPELMMRPYHQFKPKIAKFDITLGAIEDGDRLNLSLRYSTRLFAKETIERFITYFKRIALGIARSPDQRISEIDILSAEEKNRLLKDFNQTAFDYPKDKTLHELFEEQVERTPDKIALVGPLQIKSRTNRIYMAYISYRELNKKSNQLALLLRERGVQPNMVIGLMAERSVEMIVGMLAIIKAGGAYLPIDPENPTNRIINILKDTRAHLLLTGDNGLANHSFTALQQPFHSLTWETEGSPPRCRMTDLDQLPFPNRSLVNYQEYNQYIGLTIVKNSISLQATRGCPYNCAYCSKIWPKKHFVRSAENLLEEVKLYYNLGVRRFDFVDDIFNLDMDNSQRFFRLIIKEGLNIQLFFSAGLRGDLLTEEYIDLMVQAGTVNMALALETASPRLQKLIGKNLNLEKLRENIEYISRKYPHVILELFTMHGFPTETQQEAMMTLEFIKSIQWLHFPYVHILKIYPNTDMEKLALDNGITAQAIASSMELAWHELPETLPFEKTFTQNYQAEFLDTYFLNKERLLLVLPHQVKLLTEDEILQKYNSYLPIQVSTLEELLQYVGIESYDPDRFRCLQEKQIFIPHINEKMKQAFPAAPPGKNPFKVLLLDLSQYFSSHRESHYDPVEPPLGLMYILTWLNQQMGSQVQGRIAKSRIDFDSWDELGTLLEEFKPDLIGIRTLTYYRQFFHKTVSLIRQWGIDVPLIAGGPYATSDYRTLLQDPHVDLAVLGEGEVTFTRLVKKILENHRRLPHQAVLKTIEGLAFVPGSQRQAAKNTGGIIMSNTLHHLPQREFHENLKNLNKSSDLAYTIFTSGSTGKPKGVLVEHYPVVNLAIYQEKRFNITEDDRILQFSSLCFDASVEQIFISLFSGATLVLIDKDTILDSRLFEEFISTQMITHLHAVPSFLNNIRRENNYQLKRIISGGEVCPVSLAKRWIKHCDFFNEYGPTETTVASIEIEVKEVDEALPALPIGTPLGNTTVYLLDREMKLVPPGVVGEMYIGGEGVARGYLNHPELTAERFCLRRPGNLFEKRFPGPSQNFLLPEGHLYLRAKSQEPRAILYKTGDLARWLPDGSIALLGRIDHQVKIRGYRIELGEIESRLSKLPSLKETAVITHKDKNADTCLCAYIVYHSSLSSRDSGQRLNPGELKTYLSQTLPAYMIPTYFTELEALPLTPTGKLDRRALPPPGLETGQTYKEPGNKIERKLVDIWWDVLGRVPLSRAPGQPPGTGLIGIDDNFFELGGHSLKATILISKIHKEFKVKIPLTSVFKFPTIRGLSIYVGTAKKKKYQGIEAVEKREYYTLSSAQKRLYFLQQLDLTSTTYNMPMILPLFNARTGIEKNMLESTLKKLITGHESLRTSFVRVKEIPMQKIHEPGTVDLSFDYYEADEIKAREIAANFVKPFDLSQAPLVRSGVISLPGEQYVWVADMHHIVSDGTSRMILTEDFISLYNGKELGTLRIQYKDFSTWQNFLFEKGRIKSQEDYWLELYANKEIPRLNLPTDFRRPEIFTSEGNSNIFKLEREDAREFKALGARNGATLYMNILAVLNVLFYKYTGQADIIIGCIIAGRPHADLQAIIGTFVNALAMRNYPDQEKTYGNFLKEVIANSVNAFENQDFQFEELVDRLELERDTSRNPLFDISMVVQNFRTANQGSWKEENSHQVEQLPAPGKNLPLLQYINATSTFDITFIIHEQEEDVYIKIEYYTAIFKKETIQRLESHFKNIIKAVIEKPSLQLNDIDITSEAEKQQVLYEFNDTSKAYPGHKTLHQLFEKQAAKTPDNIAVIGPLPIKSRTYMTYISYRELNNKSNQLAHLLRKKGVHPNIIVGLMAERPVRDIIGILAIIKAGGAYLPIDPENPTDRIIDLLNDAHAHLLLTGDTGTANHSFTALQQPFRCLPGKTILSPPRSCITDLDQLPIPNRSLVNYQKYNQYIALTLVKNSISLLGTRGCPYNCAYCSKIWPKKHFVRSAENLLEEVKLYYHMGVRRFDFVDDIFNLDMDNSQRFFRLIIREKLDLHLLFSGGMRGDLLTEEYIDLMVQAGTINVALALETASPRLQKLIGKNLNLEKLEKNIRYITQKYPHLILELFTMHGFPTETREEAMMTLEFIKRIKWLHFPYVHILKIYPNTDMEKLALDNGITAQAIASSMELAYHQLPETLPFEKTFTQKYQAEFLNSYFLNKERLLKVLPQQVKFLTEDEILQKYNSYLPIQVTSLEELLHYVGIESYEPSAFKCLQEKQIFIPHINEKMKQAFPAAPPGKTPFKVLLLDLSQHFSSHRGSHYDPVEPPLGLMYILTWLNRELGSQVQGRIAKSRIDFDSWDELRTLLEEFNPDIIGIRTLTYYRQFFHKTVSIIRQWGIHAPLIAGGPYATSDYQTLLQDTHVDLAVLGEGEVTFTRLVKKILENNRRLPNQAVLKTIAGLAFLPGSKRKAAKTVNREIIMPNTLDYLLQRESLKNLRTINQSTDLAYIIFTSGSTGKPKGVMVEHYPVLNLAFSQKKYFNITKDERVLQFSSICFDASVEQIFISLFSGAVLVLIDKDTILDRQLFEEFISKQQITHIHAVPSFLNNIQLENNHQLKRIISGGDVCPVSLAKKWMKECDFYNEYGPTETTVTSIEIKVKQVDEALPGLPIGKPINNTTVYLLDRGMKLVPPGIVGEMYIGGEGVARGYLNRPELTAQKFQRGWHPRSRKNSRYYRSYRSYKSYIIYKTGDLARWLPDGSIALLGRIDHQVKIRGYRIELGEIESQLLKLPSIKEALVLTHKDRKGDTCLCAYIVFHASLAGSNAAAGPVRRLNAGEVKSYLAQTLPAYMIPAYITELEALPLTSTGKPDRKALPLPRLDTGQAYQGPGDVLERKLIEIWTGVLLGKDNRSSRAPVESQPPIGIDDNFFSLGGHSLNATILISRIHKELEVRISLVEMFKRQTIREMAEYIRRAAGEKFVSITLEEKKEYYPLASAQKRLFIIHKLQESSTAYNIDMKVIMEGKIKKDKLEDTFRNLIRRHESIRTSFEITAGEVVQKIHDEVEFEIEYYDLTGPGHRSPNKRQNRGNTGKHEKEYVYENRPEYRHQYEPAQVPYVTRITGNFRQPFDLSRAPLLKVGLIQLEEEKYILIVDMHHIISDGASHTILQQEILSLYHGQGLHPLKVRYRDYAQWQNSQKNREASKRQEQYWLNRYKAGIPQLNMPHDFPRPAVQNFAGSSIHFEIGSKETHLLKELAFEANATLFMVLFSILNIFLSKICDQEQVIVGIPRVGRNHADLQNIIGMFANTLVLDHCCSSEITFEDFLPEVRDRTLEAFANEDYQFEDLVDKLLKDREPGRNPLFDVVFQLTHFDPKLAASPGRENPGLQFKLYDYKRKNAAFDLFLAAHEAREKLKFYFEYNTTLFRQEKIERFIKYFKEIVSTVLENKTIRLEDIAISHDLSVTRKEMLRSDQGDFAF